MKIPTKKDCFHRMVCKTSDDKCLATECFHFCHESHGAIESIICAAIWYNDKIVYEFQPKGLITGYVIGGWRHFDCVHTYIAITHHINKDIEITQGFLTSKGRFVDSKEAGQIAFEAGQISKPTDCLVSEDLY